MSDSEVKLKPCPFCASDVVRCNCGVAQCTMFICDSCEMEFKPYSSDRDACDKLWNNRPSKQSKINRILSEVGDAHFNSACAHDEEYGKVLGIIQRIFNEE